LGAQNRCTLARFARRISKPGHLLATAGTVGNARGVAQYLACLSFGTGRARHTGLGRKFSGCQLRSSKKRGECVGKTKRGKGTKWMVVVDGSGIPLGSQLASASPAEVTLAESTLKKVSVPQPRGRARSRPLRVIADRGYNSDPLRWRLLKRGILLITPHRKSRKKPSLNDGRTLATLSQTLENRTNLRLAGKLPTSSRPS
jgi:hypothetical protein